MRTHRKQQPPSHRALDAIYAELPRLECKRLCQRYCGVIMLSRLERERIIAQVGTIQDRGLTCPLLDQRSGLCRVYHRRPLICRVWGLTPDLRCPHGCEPERWLSNEEVEALIGRISAIGGLAVELVSGAGFGQEPVG